MPLGSKLCCTATYPSSCTSVMFTSVSRRVPASRSAKVTHASCTPSADAMAEAISSSKIARLTFVPFPSRARTKPRGAAAHAVVVVVVVVRLLLPLLEVLLLMLLVLLVPVLPLVLVVLLLVVLVTVEKLLSLEALVDVADVLQVGGVVAVVVAGQRSAKSSDRAPSLQRKVYQII